MAFQNFEDQVGPVISAEWLNQVDKLKVTADPPEPFADGDATPSVEGVGSAYTENTVSTSITNFDDGVEGQNLDLLVTDANTTFVHGATLQTNTGSNVVAGQSRLYSFKLINDIWYMR